MAKKHAYTDVYTPTVRKTRNATKFSKNWPGLRSDLKSNLEPRKADHILSPITLRLLDPELRAMIHLEQTNKAFMQQASRTLDLQRMEAVMRDALRMLYEERMQYESLGYIALVFLVARVARVSHVGVEG